MIKVEKFGITISPPDLENNKTFNSRFVQDGNNIPTLYRITKYQISNSFGSILHSQFCILRPSLLAMLFALFTLVGGVWGQTATATWALTSEASVSSLGNIAATSMALGSGVGTAAYGVNGVTCANFNGAVCTPNATDYFEFTISANCGNNISVTSITFTALNNNGTRCLQLFQSVDGAAEAQVGSNFSTTTTSTNYITGTISIAVGQGKIIRLRLYGATGNTARSFTLKNFVVNGITTAISQLTPSVSISSNDTNNTFCSGSNVTFIASASNTGGGTVTYQSKVNGGNVGSNAITYSSTTLANNDQVSCSISISGGSCLTGTSANSSAITNTVITSPTILGITPSSRCGTGTVSLDATASTGSLNWYAAASGGSSLTTGTSYTTPSISATSTYHVDATSNGCTTATRTAVFATVNSVPVATALSSPVNAAIGVSTSPTLSWDAVSEATSYDVYLGTTSPDAFVGNVSINSYTPASTLNGSTVYYWNIVAKNTCGDATASSTRSFTTICSSACNSVCPNVIASLPVSNQSLSCTSVALPGNFSSSNVTVCGGATSSYLGGKEAVYKFTPSGTGETTISYSGQSWSAIWLFDGCPTSGGTCVGSVGSSASSQSLTANVTSGITYYLLFDTYPAPNSPCAGTFSISAVVTCLPPSSLIASNITATTADLSWTAASQVPSSGYQYAVTTSATPPASGTTTTSIITSITNLLANTTYYLHVRSNCIDFSNWVTSTPFTTPCIAISSFPWTETFSDNSSTRSCWSFIDGNADSDEWGISTSNPFDAGGIHASLYTDYHATNQDYLMTPQISLGSSAKQLKFQVRHYSNSEPDNLKVKLSTTGSQIANFNSTLLTLSTAQLTTTYTEYSVNLSAYSGNVYIAFAREDAPADGWYLYIDEVKILNLPTYVPSCATYISPTNIESVVPSTGSVQLSWNAVTDADSYNVYKEGVFVANTISTSYTLTGNTVGNSYSWYIVPKNLFGSAIGCNSSAISFSCISVPLNDDPCGAIALTISNSISYSTYSNTGATGTVGPPASGCASYSTADVWFSVTVPQSGTLIFDSQTGTMTDGGMAVYSGTCGSLTLVACNDDSSPNGAMPYISLSSRTPGETLWIRFWEYGGGLTGTFGLCITSIAADITSATPNQNNVCPGTSVILTANGVDGTAYWFNTCGTSSQLGIGSILSVSPSSTTTYYVRNYRYGNFSSNCTSLTVTVTQPSTSIIVNNASISNDDYLWNGITSPDGSVASNWYVFDGTNYIIAIIPPTTQNVFIVSSTTATNCVSTSNSPFNPASGEFTAGNVYIGSGTTLTQSHGSTFSLTGNFINNGIFTPSTGTVTMNGSSPQAIGGSTATTFNNLIINNTSGGVTLDKDAIVNGTLTLTSGRFSLGINNLTLGTIASISGIPSASNMIVAASTGELRKRFSSAVSNQPTFIFPIGTIAGGNEYSPVEIDFNSGSFNAEAYMGVRVDDQRTSFMNGSITNYVNRNWLVEPFGITSPNYDITLHYVQNDWIGNIGAEGSVLPIKYSTSSGVGMWYQPESADFTNAEPIGSGFGDSGANFLNWQSVTSFSQFGGAEGNNQPLPVELLSFSGVCENGIVDLTWKTASEFNSSYYILEKSTDGENWREVDNQPSAGFSNEELSYQFIDESKNDDNTYYRLSQFDFDGESTVYNPIFISCDASSNLFQTLPNPSDASFQVLVNNESLVGKATIKIVDTKGRVVSTREVQVEEGTNLFYLNENRAPGIYYISISNGNVSTEVVKHSMR
jgi:hypothetical protein